MADLSTALLHYSLIPGQAGDSNRYLEKAASMYTRAKYHDNQKRLDKSEHLLSSIKYDGANYFMAFDEAGVPKFISRKTSVSGDVIEKADRVPHLAKPLPSQAGKVYNVELIHTGHDPKAVESHSRVSGLLNALSARSTREQAEDGPIRAVVFDLIHPKVETFEQKLPHIQGLVKDFSDTSLVFHPEYAYGREGLSRLAASSKKEGREGIITLDPTKPEDKNPRVKLKHIDHYNLKISKIHQEIDIHGNPKPSAGSVSVVDAVGKELGKVGTGFDKKTRDDIWTNPHEWLDKIIQVKAMPSKTSKLRQPVYNGDADGNLDTV